MEKLFTPDFGLMIWTALTFLLLVVVLGKFGWGPLIRALEERESALRAEREAAEAARAQAQRLEGSLKAELAGIESRGRELISQAAKEGEAARQRLKVEAEAEAQKIKDKAMAELADEKKRLVAELRRDVAELSVMAAEKLIRRSVDDGVQKSVMDDFFKEMESRKAKN